eukprot:76851-Heterocapsa_arctica.AAC.1
MIFSSCLNPSVWDTVEDDKDEDDEDLKFITFGTLLDHRGITVEALLEHLWMTFGLFVSTFGTLLERFSSAFFLCLQLQ